MLDLGPLSGVHALGSDRCVGLDRSMAMCRRARERGALVVRADAEALPFRDATFSGTRADRTLQHLVDPVPALRELLRVLLPGAPLVLADPDQESLVIQVPGVRQSVLDRLKALRRDVGYRSGRWVSKAPAILEELGAEVTSVEAFALTLDRPMPLVCQPGLLLGKRPEGSLTRRSRSGRPPWVTGGPASCTR